jgi:hypothetical protein
LLAYLHADFVRSLGWLTDKQLIDAIAIGRCSPFNRFHSVQLAGFISELP